MIELAKRMLACIVFGVIFDGIYRAITHRAVGPFQSLVDAIIPNETRGRVLAGLAVGGMVLGAVAIGLFVLILLLRVIVWGVTF